MAHLGDYTTEPPKTTIDTLMEVAVKNCDGTPEQFKKYEEIIREMKRNLKTMKKTQLIDMIIIGDMVKVADAVGLKPKPQLNVDGKV